MNPTPPIPGPSESKETWLVVILYDDPATRQRAMEVCDHLAKRFWSEVDLKFHWWRTDFLEDAGMAATAAENSCNADFVLVSLLPETEMPPLIRRWFEGWVTGREGREGALIDLTASADAGSLAAHRNRLYLRELAHRAGMDYLAHVPAEYNRTLPDSFESASLRATQITTVLDGILQHSPPPRLDPGP